MLDTMNRSGMRPSRRICAGRKFRFHCCKTIRVLSNPAIEHRRANGAYARRHHPRVGVDERQDARAVIERTRDDGGQVVVGRHDTKAAANVRHLTRCSAEYLRRRGAEAPWKWLRIVLEKWWSLAIPIHRPWRTTEASSAPKHSSGRKFLADRSPDLRADAVVVTDYGF